MIASRRFTALIQRARINVLKRSVGFERFVLHWLGNGNVELPVWTYPNFPQRTVGNTPQYQIYPLSLRPSSTFTSTSSLSP